MNSFNLYSTDYDSLFKGVIFIHILILILIIGEYLKNPKSIHYPITRLQLVILIISLWVFIMIYKNNDLKENN